MKKIIEIPYADESKRLEIKMENLLFIAMPELPQRPSLIDDQNEVERALLNPIGIGALQDTIRPDSTVVILVDDFTRPTPVSRILPPVIRELEKAGVTDSQIRIVIARGTHRKLSTEEMKQKIGSDIFHRFEVLNHENDKNLVELGRSTRGTPIWISRNVIDADFRIAIGSICAHPIAGYGGGAKIVVPGVSGVKTINSNHSLCDSPNVAIGSIDNNPVRQDMNEIAQIAHVDFLVNVILNPHKEIIKAVAGDIVQAHRNGTTIYNCLYGARFREEADIVVVGSSPRDATFGHATFALYAAMPMVKRGGSIILVAPCTEGAGSSEYRERFHRLATTDPTTLMNLIKNGHVDASDGAFDYCYSKVLSKCQVILISDSYSKTEAKEIGVDYSDSLQEAIDKEISKIGDHAKVAVLPVGGLTVPIKERIISPQQWRDYV